MPSNFLLDQIPTEKQLFDWLKVKTRTYDWDFALFYDRDQANRQLMQEYINRYAQGESHFEPITRRMTIISGEHWEYLHNTLMDAPRLSFEDSTIGGSRATLTMRVMGGTHLTVKQEPGQAKRVTRVESYDPLLAPTLTASIDLNLSDGFVSEDNQVKIDISKGAEFKFVFGTSGQAQDAAGRFFQNLFEGLRDDQKVFVLNTIEPVEEGEHVNPEQFRVRVMPAPGAHRRDAVTYRQGAVMVFVAAKGNPPGALPDAASEWVYPIPLGSTSTLLYGNRLFMKNLVSTGLKNSPHTVATDWDLRFHEDGGGISGFTVNYGYARFFDVENDDQLGALTVEIPYLTLFQADAHGSFVEFTASVQGERIEFVWRGKDPLIVGPLRIRNDEEYEEGDIAHLTFDHNAMQAFVCEASTTGGVRVVAVDEPAIEVSSRIWHVDDDFADMEDRLVEIGDRFTRQFIKALYETLIDGTFEIELFRLHGLLFQDRDIIHTGSIRLPKDLALFGTLAPQNGSFVTEPLEPVLLAGGKLQMNVTPAITGVSWRIEPVEGYGGGTGSVSSDGLYSAPSAELYRGNYTMVRLVAQKAGRSSSALVRVVTREVIANPLIASAALGKDVLKVSGGAIDGGPVEWSLKTATGAKLSIEPPEPDVEFEVGDRFYVAGSASSGAPFSVDEITATNPRTGVAATSYILVIEGGLSGSMYVDDTVQLPENQLKFVLDLGVGPAPGVEWAVVAGGGSIDVDGVFTMDESAPQPFSVISAALENPAFGNFYNYIILPIPLIDLEAIQGAIA